LIVACDGWKLAKFGCLPLFLVIVGVKVERMGRESEFLICKSCMSFYRLGVVSGEVREKAWGAWEYLGEWRENCFYLIG
jgi:hypothetical protein